MRGKILLVAGLGAGYILGARAGRQRYDQIVEGAQKFWRDPRVQKQVQNAESFARDKGPEISHAVQDSAKSAVSKGQDAAKKVQSKVTGGGSSDASI